MLLAKIWVKTAKKKDINFIFQAKTIFFKIIKAKKRTEQSVFLSYFNSVFRKTVIVNIIKD